LVLAVLEVQQEFREVAVMGTLDQVAVILYLAPLRQMVAVVVEHIRLVVPLKLPELAEGLAVVEQV